jgi:hypothetical protein
MKNSTIMAMVLIALTSSVADAQKEGQNEKSNGMFETREEYNRFMGSVKDASKGNPEMKAMIPLINDVAQGREFGSTAKQYRTSGSELGLLANPDIREDIEMVDEQYQELKNRNREIQQRMADQLRSVNLADSENVVLEIRAIREQAQRELNDVLLPHQLTRLRQIRMQAELQRRSLVDILAEDPFRSELEITDDQMDALKSAEEEIELELQREIAKLREKMRDRLLSRLNRSQQTQVEELIGDTFEFSDRGKGKSDKKSKGEKKSKAGGKPK